MSKILIVEDEDKIARFVELELTHEGYEVDKAVDGRAGVEAAQTGAYDLILLDVMLPELSGLEVLRRVRRTADTPVILLTARDAVIDKVAGLDAGADDYITKPFAIEELLARIRVALKRTPIQAAEGANTGMDGNVASNRQSDRLAGQIGDRATTSQPEHSGALRVASVTLDPIAHEVLVGSERVELTNREFEVLRVLMEHRNMVMSRDQLVHEACGYEYVGETNVIDVYVRHIRAKIDERFGIELISTVRGVGYVTRSR